MRDVPDSRHWDCAHELVGEAGQLRLEQSHDMAIRSESGLGLSLVRVRVLEAKVAIFIVHVVYHQAVGVESLVDVVGEAGVVVRPVVSLVAAADLPTVDEVEVR